MSCSSDRLDEVLHPGTPESVQTDPIPTEQLKTLKSFDPEGSNCHVSCVPHRFVPMYVFIVVSTLLMYRVVLEYRYRE